MKNLIDNFTTHLQNIPLQQEGETPKTGNISHILLLGMGGSGIGGDVAKQLLSDSLSVPFLVEKNYQIPAFVNEKTLVIASSYSGNTEEVVEAVQLAKAKKAQLACITGGGKLMQFAKKNQWPLWSMPSGFPPRTMLGLSLMNVMSVLKAYGFVDEDIFKKLQNAALFCEENRMGMIEEAKRVAEQLSNKTSVIYSSSAYQPVALRLKQQINENSKHPAFQNIWPELNHNEIVGWRLAQTNFVVLSIFGTNEHQRVQYRMEVTEQLVAKQAAQWVTISLKGRDIITNYIYGFQLGDYISLYLAEVNQFDPYDIKEIDTLKDALGKKI